MAIDLYWDNDEQTIMLAVVPAQWTWDELFTMLNAVKKITDTRDYETGMILDVRKGTSVPGGSILNPDTRAKAQRLIQMSKEGKGPLVILGANGFIKLIYTTFGTLDKNVVQDVYFAQTAKEARTIMQRRLAQSRLI